MSDSLSDRVKQTLRPIPNYPKAGIVFQDITPVLQNALLLRQCVDAIVAPFRDASVSHILGIEARGFILGAPAAIALGAGFIPARKPGKLPWKARRHEYQLEYGTDALEAHEDAFPAGSRVVVVDDVLATGGTAEAAGNLVRNLGGELLGWSFLMELSFLPGRQRLTGAPSHAVTVL